jgi:hypothetical protein
VPATAVDDAVIARVAGEAVTAVPAGEVVVARVAGQAVAIAAAKEAVVAQAAAYEVVAAAGAYDVVTGARDDYVPLRCPYDHVVTPRANLRRPMTEACWRARGAVGGVGGTSCGGCGGRGCRAVGGPGRTWRRWCGCGRRLRIICRTARRAHEGNHHRRSYEGACRCAHGLAPLGECGIRVAQVASGAEGVRRS